MGYADTFRDSVASVEVNAAYSEALISLSDGSRLAFRHTVQERWVKAFSADRDATASLANQLLPGIQKFRLNAKHLEIEFGDGGRWERRFARSGY
jgi:hypothetical protein